MSFLAENHLLALMVVIGLGFLVGRARIGTFSLGISAVLFVGLALSAIEPDIALPPLVYEFGLVVFVYTIGLSAGPGFLASLRARGVPMVVLVLSVLTLAAVEVALVVSLLPVAPAEGAGLFAGALTNTPALAAILDAVPRTLPAGDVAEALTQPVVAYSLTYPAGVLGAIGAMAILGRAWRIDHAAEARAAGVAAADLETWTLELDDRYRSGATVTELIRTAGVHVTVSRVISPEGRLKVAGDDDDVVHSGDRVVLVGVDADLARARDALGTRVATELGHPDLDYRRIFVSDPAVAGRRLRDLALQERLGARITRIRRGDVDMVADADSVLRLGDRVRVVAPADRMREVTRTLGDSYRGLSEVDVLSFSVGIVLGLLLGAIPFPIPGGGELRLGAAGGPLLVALVLGAVGRTGKVVWQLPYSANLTLRQLGVVLFLAGIGTTAGSGFGAALSDPASLLVIGVAAAVTLTVSAAVLVIGHRVMGLPFGMATGVLASVQTQPAALAFASEQAANDLPQRGYTAVYPFAMVAKIVLAQVLLIALVALG